MRVFVFVLVLVACAAGPAPVASTGDLVDPVVRTVLVDGQELRVAVASTAEERSRGLRGIDDLGDLDGMLFSWDRDGVTSRFTMAGTLIDLDIAFFAADGTFVDGFTMTPCTAEPCPTYAAGGSYAYALETPAGSLVGVGTGSVLDLVP